MASPLFVSAHHHNQVADWTSVLRPTQLEHRGGYVGIPQLRLPSQVRIEHTNTDKESARGGIHSVTTFSLAGLDGFEPCSLETKKVAHRPRRRPRRGEREFDTTPPKSGFQKDAVPHELPGYPLAQTRLCATPAASQPNKTATAYFLRLFPALHVSCFGRVCGVILVREGAGRLRSNHLAIIATLFRL